MGDFTDKIREQASINNYWLTHHVIQRMSEKQISEQEIIEVVLCGGLIETFPKSDTYPKCVFMHPIRTVEPLYVVCGYDGTRVHIITAHWHDPNKWSDWWTRISNK